MNKITMMLLQNPRTRGMIQSATMKTYKFKQEHKSLTTAAPAVASGVVEGMMRVAIVIKGVWMIIGAFMGALLTPSLSGAIIGATIGLLIGWVQWLKITPDEDEGPLGPTLGVVFGLLFSAVILNNTGKTFYTDFYEVMFLLIIWPVCFGFIGSIFPPAIKFIMNPTADKK